MIDQKTSPRVDHAPRLEPVPDRSRVVGDAVALVILVLVLVGACVAAAAMGAYDVAPGRILRTVFAAVVGPDPAADPTVTAVLWQVRFPRVVLGALVGACLGVGGALLQGMFRNPLAEPAVIGVSAGSALGAAAAIATGVAALGGWTVTAAAFAGGLLTTLLVYGVARSGGRIETVTLVLTGIAVNAVAGAGIGLATFLSTDAQIRSIAFWNLGSLGGATWSAVATIAPAAAIGLVAAPWFARKLDLLALGEDVAGHLGVDVQRLRLTLVAVVALLTAAAVALAGILTFAGLVVPHVMRLWRGPRHRVLLPASALGGAIVLVASDLAARTLAAPAEIPLGVLTALVGGPFFFWLLVRTRADHGGWA